MSDNEISEAILNNAEPSASLLKKMLDTIPSGAPVLMVFMTAILLVDVILGHWNDADANKLIDSIPKILRMFREAMDE